MSHISIDCTRDEDFILNNKKNNKVDKHNNNLSNHPKYFTWCKCHIHLSNNNIYPDKCFMQCGLKPTETIKEPKNEKIKKELKKLHIEPKNEKIKKELTKEREIRDEPKNEKIKKELKKLHIEPKNDIKNEKRKKIHYIYRACVILNINKRPIKKQKINHILK